jgi:hypothetical protein
MPAHVRRATVDCALSAGWVCIATLATVDPVRWRTICYALSDTFATPSIASWGRPPAGRARDFVASPGVKRYAALAVPYV